MNTFLHSNFDNLNGICNLEKLEVSCHTAKSTIVPCRRWSFCTTRLPILFETAINNPSPLILPWQVNVDTFFEELR